MIEVICNVGYEDELSYTDIIEMKAGTLVEAQDRSIGIIALDGFDKPKVLVLFTPNPSVVRDGNQGYTRFRVHKPARIVLHEVTREP